MIITLPPIAFKYSPLFLCISLKYQNFDAGKQPKDLEVEQLLQEVEKYTLASHILWALWGLISVYFSISYPSLSVLDMEHITTLSENLREVFRVFFQWSQDHVNEIDFNYKEYARQRFQMYWSKKCEVLNHRWWCLLSPENDVLWLRAISFCLCMSILKCSRTMNCIHLGVLLLVSLYWLGA